MAESRRIPVDPAQASLSGGATRRLLMALADSGVSCRFVAHGSSMHPFVRDGDAITVRPRPAGGPRVGDVVAVSARPSLPVSPGNPGRLQSEASGRLLVHRVVAKDGLRVLTKGDNLAEPDGWFDAASVLGVVRRVERDGRRRRLGLGAGGRLVARLSRSGLLAPLVGAARLLGRRRRARGGSQARREPQGGGEPRAAREWR